ncbi:LOW QUALITY PROTEIN: hypothetical protein YC2023_033547 [Brassica napus]
MAMSKIQPVLLLFVSLFFLPALCSIDYEYCDKNSIHGGYVGVSVKAGESTYNVARYPLCDESKNVYSIKLVDTDVGLIEAPINVCRIRVTYFSSHIDICLVKLVGGYSCPFKSFYDYVLSKNTRPVQAVWITLRSQSDMP